MPETVDFEFTPELQEKLKGFLPIDIDSTFEHIPKIYQELEAKFQPTFKLKERDGIEISRSIDAAGAVSFNQGTGERTWVSKLGIRRIDTLKVCVVTWSNYRTQKGKEIKYKGPESIAVLPDALQQELYDVVCSRSVITEEELAGLE